MIETNLTYNLISFRYIKCHRMSKFNSTIWGTMEMVFLIKGVHNFLWVYLFSVLSFKWGRQNNVYALVTVRDTRRRYAFGINPLLRECVRACNLLGA